MMTDSERKAISKAQALGGAALVQRLRHGKYRVPSATEAGVFYTVTGTAMDASDHRCDCPAGLHGRACWHVSAVRLARIRAEALKQAARLAEAQVREHQPIVLAEERAKRAAIAGTMQAAA